MLGSGNIVEPEEGLAATARLGATSASRGLWMVCSAVYRFLGMAVLLGLGS